MFTTKNKSSALRVITKINVANPTNAERLIAWQQRMQRNQRAIRHGIAIAFPLPIIRV